MDKIHFKYDLEDKPPISEWLLYSLQWLAITITTIIILGTVLAGLHFTEMPEQVHYLQKLFFVTAVGLLVQLLWGHQLPLICAPASVLFVGIIASLDNSIHAIYSSIMMGGAVLALISATRLFPKLQNLFTARVIATILMLIAFTITPTILNLIFTVPEPGMEFLHFCFTLGFTLAMFGANRFLKGIWKSTLIVWALVGGSLLYLVIVPQRLWPTAQDLQLFSIFLTAPSIHFTFDAGLLISFLVCFLALSINDLGSIQSLGGLIKPPHMTRRITAGTTVTGLTNVLAGFLGVVGPVNLSLSTGVIAANGVASRFTLIPVGIGLLIMSFLPRVLAFISNIPPLIMGIILLYIMCSQIAAGLMLAFKDQTFTLERGLIIGLPLMIAVIVSFLPEEALAAFPPLLVPILGNGFVMGAIAVLLMEHVVYRK